jgi:tetratricopeptide (TPR) repeat protein
MGDRKSAHFTIPEHLAGRSEQREALAHYDLGVAFRQQGLHNEALREYRLALEGGEDRNRVLEAMAEVHLLFRDHGAALELYDMLVAQTAESPKLWNERGVVLHQLGRSDEALDSFQHALAFGPNYALARNNLAVTLAQEKRHEDALHALRDAIRADASLAIPRLNLGLLLFTLGRLQPALKIYRQVVDADPNSAAGWNGVGLVLSELDRAEDARNAFARAAESDPKSAEAHYNLSFALSTLGDYDGALRAVTRAQQLDPYYVPQKFRFAIDLQYEDPSISVVPEVSADVAAEGAGQSLAFEKDVLDELFAELTPAAPKRPSRALEDPLALARDYLSKGLLDLAAAETNRALARSADPIGAHILLGHLYTRRGLHGEALDHYREAKTLDPDRTDARLGQIRAQLGLGRGNKAVEDAVALAGEQPDDVEVLIALAEVLIANGNPADALEALGRARTLAPHRADVLKLAGDVQVSVGELQAARRTYEDALAIDPRLVQLLVGLGRVHEAEEDWQAAAAAYQSALEVLPTYSEAVLALARLWRRQGDPKPGVRLLADFLAADPSDVDALLLLGHLLLDDERFEHALEAFNRAIVFDDTNAEAHFCVGVAWARLRQFSEAVSAWERVLAIDSAGRLADKARQHIRSAKDLQHIFGIEAA